MARVTQKEAREFKASAVDYHASSDRIEYHGNGSEVLVSILQDWQWSHELLGEASTMWHGGEFRYSDYFPIA